MFIPPSNATARQNGRNSRNSARAVGRHHSIVGGASLAAALERRERSTRGKSATHNYSSSNDGHCRGVEKVGCAGRVCSAERRRGAAHAVLEAAAWPSLLQPRGSDDAGANQARHEHGTASASSPTPPRLLPPVPFRASKPPLQRIPRPRRALPASSQPSVPLGSCSTRTSAAAWGRWCRPCVPTCATTAWSGCSWPCPRCSTLYRTSCSSWEPRTSRRPSRRSASGRPRPEVGQISSPFSQIPLHSNANPQI